MQLVRTEASQQKTKLTERALSPSLWVQGYKYYSCPPMKRDLSLDVNRFMSPPSPHTYFSCCHPWSLKVNTPTQTIRSVPILVKFMCFLRKRKKAFEKKDTINQDRQWKKIQNHRKIVDWWQVSEVGMSFWKAHALVIFTILTVTTNSFCWYYTINI